MTDKLTTFTVHVADVRTALRGLASDHPYAQALYTQIDKPSPETGHVGWCWWAMGSMGDAPTYEAARDSAVAEIQRRMDRRMAVL